MPVAPPPLHQVVIVAFDGMQSLDAVGPYEVFAGATLAVRGQSSQSVQNRPDDRLARTGLTGMNVLNRPDDQHDRLGRTGMNVLNVLNVQSGQSGIT